MENQEQNIIHEGNKPIIRKIIAYKSYYHDFMKKLSDEEQKKIKRSLLLFETEDKIPYHYIKYIKDGLYEFRVTHKNTEFRIFFIYDGEQIVVLFNSFKKKTQKTPQNEIDKALTLKKEYYESKRNNGTKQ
ncbi:MAG: type II toxin-antitoxin system RelE/ParE family toxin [Bacteroidales bacterium]|jgi:phage-related protein|nr:type II toxin-antitoxin system RelE/ParE family toxin [Bacteroidales bacterium]